MRDVRKSRQAGAWSHRSRRMQRCCALEQPPQRKLHTCRALVPSTRTVSAAAPADSSPGVGNARARLEVDSTRIWNRRQTTWDEPQATLLLESSRVGIPRFVCQPLCCPLKVCAHWWETRAVAEWQAVETVDVWQSEVRMRTIGQQHRLPSQSEANRATILHELSA